ncbi:MAG: hypothetical protein OXC40_00570 [Proteobacteria bacterium]|nr:hypothetical protein [Pseudomonadota bacterium]
MSKTLKASLESGRVILKEVESKLKECQQKPISDKTINHFQTIIQCHNSIDHWIFLIEEKSKALAKLQKLKQDPSTIYSEPPTDPSTTSFSLKQAPNDSEFKSKRWINLLSHITSQWALVDSISAMVGRVFCTRDIQNNYNPAKLIQHFINNKKAPGLLYKLLDHQSIRSPAIISYAIRNIVVHDGAYVDSSDLFESTKSESILRLSKNGWKAIKDKATYREQSSGRIDIDEAVIWSDNQCVFDITGLLTSL